MKQFHLFLLASCFSQCVCRFFVLASVLFVLASCSMSDDEAPADNTDNLVNVGDPLPAFTIMMNDGSMLSTADLKGKPSLIVFFSTTCPDCQRELPIINARYLAHGNDTTFVAISREEGPDAVAAYWQSNGITLPFSAQTDRAVYSLFAKKGIPRTYISDSNGIVRSVTP